jgi:hypothetical protein
MYNFSEYNRFSYDIKTQTIQSEGKSEPHVIQVQRAQASISRMKIYF